MSKFKGTKGELERKYVGNVCIGIGTVGSYSQITANTILPETDEDYIKESTEIQANMLLYSKSPQMLEMLEKIEQRLRDGYSIESSLHQEIKALINESTEI